MSVASRIMTRLCGVNKFLTKLGVANAIIGGGFGVYESTKLYLEGYTFTELGFPIVVLPPLGAIMGFAIGYTSPVMVPVILYNIGLPDCKGCAPTNVGR